MHFLTALDRSVDIVIPPRPGTRRGGVRGDGCLYQLTEPASSNIRGELAAAISKREARMGAASEGVTHPLKSKGEAPKIF